MIRINLLNTEKRRSGKRAPSESVVITGGGIGMYVWVLIVALGSGLAMYLMYMQGVSEGNKLQKDFAAAIAENQRLSIVKTNYEASKAKADQFESRVEVIDKLRAQQDGPMKLLDLVASTVNDTEAVWLETMTDDGKNIDFTGMALSPNAVADLMLNLRKTRAFKSVEIKETAQDNGVKDLQAFKFELVCEKSADTKKS